MVRVKPSRRRFLSILGCVSAVGMLPLTGSAFGKGTGELVRWSGRAMGADAAMVLSGIDPNRAKEIFSACEKEIYRLEGLFSLHRLDSVLSKLNRDGFRQGDSPEFAELIRTAIEIAALTEGAFDPTVQPLWTLYADHFRDGGDPSGPNHTRIKLARALVGYRSIILNNESISFAKPGMALTLNGIAQGYVTDRITALLKAQGVEHVLVNMGEYKALGDYPNGGPWRVAIRDPEKLFETIDRVSLRDAAMATSGGYGMRFDRAGRFHHLFDPITGRSTVCYSSVTVEHVSATWADALSTGFSAMSEVAVAGVLANQEGAKALLVRRDGQLVRLG